MLVTNQTEAIRATLHSQRGNLGIVMVIDDAGRPIGLDSTDASAREAFDALYAFARRVLAYEPTVGLDPLTADDEIVFFDWDGRQVICKAFAADNRTWILVALVPADKGYKQAVTKVIKALQKILTPPEPKKPRAKRAAKAAELSSDAESSAGTEKPKRTRHPHRTEPPTSE